METINNFLGHGTDVSALQMTTRALVVFVISLLFLRISGRRSFGMGTPYDNIVIILLGSVLARAIAGASPFWPTLSAALSLAITHRLLGMLVLKSKMLATIVEGNKILLYENGEYLEKNLLRAMVRREDIMHSLRKILQSERLDMIDSIYMERDGEITIKVKSNVKV